MDGRFSIFKALWDGEGGMRVDERWMDTIRSIPWEMDGRASTVQTGEEDILCSVKFVVVF